MTTKYLDSNGLLYLWQKIRNTFVSDVTWDSTNKKLVKKKKTGTNGAEQSTDLVTFATVATTGSYSDLSNKPSTATTSANGFMSSTDKTKLDSIASGAEVNVQSDWNQTTTTADDYIKNKPTSMTPSSHTHGNITNGGVLQTTGVAVANNDCLVVTDASDSAKVAKTTTVFDGSTTTTALTPKGTFETFSKFSGSYNDLTNKPTIPSKIFSKVKVGSITLEADATQDTLEFVEGGNIAISADPDYDKITITGAPDELFVAAYDNTTFADITAALNTTRKVFMHKIEDINNPMYHYFAPLVRASSDKYIFACGFVTDVTNKSFDSLTERVYICTPSGWSEGSSTLDLSPLKLTTDVTIGNGDKLVITDASNSNKVARTSITFDGSTTSKALTPKGTWGTFLTSHQSLAAYAPLASPALTGTPTAPTATAGTNTTQIATTAFVKNAVDTAITGAAAFQGTAPTTFAPTNYKAGWYWVVGTAGTYAGQACEAGDMIFATSDYSSAYSASDFDVIQTNLDITAITNAEIDTIVAA